MEVEGLRLRGWFLRTGWQSCCLGLARLQRLWLLLLLGLQQRRRARNLLGQRDGEVLGGAWSLRRSCLRQLDCVRLEGLRLLAWVVRLPEHGRSLPSRAVALGSVGKWRLAESIATVDGDRLMLLLECLLQRIIGRHALTGMVVLRDDPVHDRWLLEGREDVVQVSTTCYLSVIGSLPVRRERG